MIVRAKDLTDDKGRTAYPLGELQAFRHFVSRVTTPANPFVPHSHKGVELWFILEGEATVTLEGKESPVETGDLIILLPWREHGLSSKGQVRWLCIG